MTFRRELIEVINKHSKENGSNTPDHILAEYLISCLSNFDKTIKLRENWYGREIHEPKFLEDLDFESIADDINYHNDCAKATLGNIPTVTANNLIGVPPMPKGRIIREGEQPEPPERTKNYHNGKDNN